MPLLQHPQVHKATVSPEACAVLTRIAHALKSKWVSINSELDSILEQDIPTFRALIFELSKFSQVPEQRRWTFLRFKTSQRYRSPTPILFFPLTIREDTAPTISNQPLTFGEMIYIPNGVVEITPEVEALIVINKKGA